MVSRKLCCAVFELSTKSIVAASVEALHEMIVTDRQRIYFVKTRPHCKRPDLLAMEMLEVQINLPGILRTGGEVVPGARQFSALGHDDAADFRRKMINVIWIPRRIFNDLRNCERAGAQAQ
jgi:hypothetical protein